MAIMKIYVNCKSLLLQKSVESFLRNRLSTLAKADIVVVDYLVKTEKPVLLIGSDKRCTLKTPFNKSKLITVLEKIYEEKQLEALAKDGANEFEDELNAVMLEFSKKLKKIFAKRLYDAIKQNPR
ncbi:MAG: hypothetical protein RL154_424 [Pseudomonadota bacterium]|jgi:hypothetical protein